MSHSSSAKWFCVIFLVNDPVARNLKCSIVESNVLFYLDRGELFRNHASLIMVHDPAYWYFYYPHGVLCGPTTEDTVTDKIVKVILTSATSASISCSVDRKRRRGGLVMLPPSLRKPPKLRCYRIPKLIHFWKIGLYICPPPTLSWSVLKLPVIAVLCCLLSQYLPILLI